MIVGVCLPKEASQVVDLSTFVSLEDSLSLSPANDLEDLKDNQEKNIFFDVQRGILFRKFLESRDRDGENDIAECPNRLHQADGCQFLKLKLDKVENIDLFGANCV